MKRPFASVPVLQDAISEGARTRFLAKIEQRGTDECWPWGGAKTRQGYGIFNLDGQNKGAHRVAYALFTGDIAAGLTVDHLCENPSCVNPAHLEAVPHTVNLMRGSRSACANNARKTACPKGHPYSTYFHKSNGRTQRYCPTCKRDKGREWMRRHRGSLPERYRVT